jgi:prepilin-type N-terminal cleavage/methylation domain-containing protein
MRLLKIAIKPIDYSSPMNGFTLLEVMVSLSLIAIVFSVLFKLQTQTVELSESNKFNSIAPGLAQELLAQVEQDLPNWAHSEGEFGPDFPGIRWQTEITESEFETFDGISDALKNRFKQIRVTISDQNQKRTYSLSTWRISSE